MCVGALHSGLGCHAQRPQQVANLGGALEHHGTVLYSTMQIFLQYCTYDLQIDLGRGSGGRCGDGSGLLWAARPLVTTPLIARVFVPVVMVSAEVVLVLVLVLAVTLPVLALILLSRLERSCGQVNIPCSEPTMKWTET
eukprot:COSAG01_NODE_2384_length_7788_cov_8.398751_11_plen_139_part_00